MSLVSPSGSGKAWNLPEVRRLCRNAIYGMSSILYMSIRNVVMDGSILKMKVTKQYCPGPLSFIILPNKVVLI